jgi:Lrp/AsnC family transcriptional regulator for asnA, asnC and gidA
MSSIDELDLKILDILKKDSRTPFTEIASILGVSDSTIHVRLKKLRDDGVLRGFTLNLNEELLGKKVHGLAMIDVNLGHLEEVVSKLAINKNVVRIYETHGANDLIVQIDAEDLDELRKVIMDTRKIENISSTALTTILKIWK